MEIFSSQNQQRSLKFCHLFWTFEIFPKPLNGMSGSTMYFRVGCTLSPAILHILPQHFTMVSPLDRQLNTFFIHFIKFPSAVEMSSSMQNFRLTRFFLKKLFNVFWLWKSRLKIPSAKSHPKYSNLKCPNIVLAETVFQNRKHWITSSKKILLIK